jgi:hypothetical protein
MKINTKRYRPALFAAVFIVLGAVTVWSVKASPFTAAVEPETGTLSGNAATVADSSASNNSAVKFGTASGSTGAKFVTGVSSNGRYFVDQTGAPILIKGDSPWSMFTDMSPAQVELWAANRQGHGFNSAIVSLIGDTRNGGPSDTGATYDGVLPFVGGNVTQWNETYWARMDNYLTILKNHGITAFLYPIDGWTTLSGGVFYHKTAAESKTYGQMVSARYPAGSYPNIVWMAGGDYQPFDDPAVATEFTNMLAGIRAAGDNRIFSIQLNTESSSTDSTTYEPLVSWNFEYSYTSIYAQVLNGYRRPASSRDPRPSLLSESHYEGEGTGTVNDVLRRQQLWALTSGSPGEFTGSIDWLFSPGWETRLDTVWVTQAQKMRDYFSSLPNWQLLVPDDVTPLVTAGRGTKASAGSVDASQNAYVTAAQTADKSLSVVYVPTNVSDTNARTITLDLSRLPGSYSANWVDPTDATSTQAATINGSGQVTTPGLHSDGKRDWLLVIR